MDLIKKIQLFKGVSWVEIPEADVFILCGCPADIVKHLMKRGLIVSTERDGVSFETGPNVILLSDVMVQSGDFSNLAEFPVLQMLYRQGMMLPNHPNNKGVKPLLIGLKEQIKSQIQYIYRGNYGLTSVEEMIEAGISSGQAEEIMNMKLKFAFGEMQKTEDFLDTRIIKKNDPVEIRNGVSIQRLKVNEFEISYKKQSVTVDLNLQDFESYEFPYTLGFHLINRGYFSVIHFGEGDGWDVKRPSMSSIIMFHGRIYLIDAGPNILNSILALGIGINEIEGIFHTHCHDDHFAGLTALIRADRKIKYYSTPLVRASVSKKLSALLSINENSFFDYFDVHDLKLDAWNNIDGLEVKPILSPHPVETNMFLFRTIWKDGFISYAHFADIVSLKVLKKMVRDGNTGPGITQSFYEKVKEDYLTEAKLKKLDIGGGMIHGDAEDFKNDPSEKIVLSHTSLYLSKEQKKIGSGAPFGTEDILIPSYKDYVWQFAHKYLKDYFPTAPNHQIQILLNNHVVKFNPHTIILKEGVINEDMFLILTGNVEAIHRKKGSSLLYPGTLVGEISGIYKIPSVQTYFSISFVQALCVPSWLYTEFIKMNNLYQDIEHFQTIREMLGKTWLFGEGISYPVQNKIAKAVKVTRFESGKVLDNLNPASIYLVKKGLLERFKEKIVVETLKTGDFFGEEKAIFGDASLFDMRTLESTDLYEIPAELIGGIPIIRWKLFETFEKRKGLILKLELSSKFIFQWKKWFKIGISEMDDQHKKLFEMIVSFLDAIKEEKSISVTDKAMTSLIDYTVFHFDSEQQLMLKHGYPEHNNHCTIHQDLMDQIIELKEKLEKNDYEMDLNLIDFFTRWFIDHTLVEDKKYSSYVNKEEVFFNTK